MNRPHLRPSNLFRYDKCPGWWRVATPPEGASKDADKGKKLHEVMAAVIRGAIIDTLKLCPADADAVQWAFREVADLLTPGGNSVEYEMHWQDMNLKGTADLLVHRSDGFHVVDWKFGRGEVEEACDNLQLVAYACMAGVHYPGNADVVVHIVQPFLRKHDEYRHTRYTMAQAAQQIAEIRHRAETLTTLCPGSPQCDWCPAKCNCPELLRNMQVVANTEKVEKRDYIFKNVDSKQISEYADAARLARKCADAIDAEVKRRLQSGETIPGYTLQSRNVKALTSIGEAFKRLGIPADKFLGCCKASIPDIIDAFADDNGIPAFKAKEFVLDSLADIIEIKETVSIHREARK